MRQGGAFDEAVKDVGDIVHMVTLILSTVNNLDGIWPCLAGALHDPMCPKNSSNPLCAR